MCQPISVQDNNTIPPKDFHNLLSKITSEDSIHTDGKGHRKNMYKNWLIDAFKLKAFTGRRNEEIFLLK